MSKDFANIPAFQGQLDKKEQEIRSERAAKVNMIRIGKVEALEEGVKDPDPLVRKAVAKFGGLKYGFKLMHDPDEQVRIEVSKKADRNLATLMVHDPNDTVQKYCKQILEST